MNFAFASFIAIFIAYVTAMGIIAYRGRRTKEEQDEMFHDATRTIRTVTAKSAERKRQSIPPQPQPPKSVPRA